MGRTGRLQLWQPDARLQNPAQCGYLAMQDEYGWDGWLGVYFANLPNEKTTILMGMQKVDAGTFSMTRKIRNRIVSKL